MHVLKVPKKKAEKVKTKIIQFGVYDRYYFPDSDRKYVYFPVTSKLKSLLATDVSFVNRALKKSHIRITLKDALKSVLSLDELNHLKTSFDTLGDMAILEISPELKNKEKLIAETLLRINPSLNSVARKVGIHEGVYRLQKIRILAGRKTKEVTYKENNVILKFNPEKVYFSPRLSAERKRIYKLVKPGEDILVMFSGCAPYPLVISKNTSAKRIVGVEINPDAHKYALLNIKLNKAKNVEVYNGDVLKIVPSLNVRFDRILMPLPKTAEDFLPLALSVAKKGAVIHFYDFLEDSSFDDAEGKVKKACAKKRLKYKPVHLIKCGQHAPHVFRICFDFQIL